MTLSGPPSPAGAALDTAAPLRVVHVIDSLRRGGAESLLAALVGELTHQGRVSSVVCAVSGEGADPDLVSDIERSAEVRLLQGRRLLDRGVVRSLVRAARDHEAGAIHSHLCVASVNARLTARLLRLPHVTTIHSPPGAVMEDTRACLLADGLSARLSAALVAPDEAMARAFARHWRLPAARIEVIPNAPSPGIVAAGDRAALRSQLAPDGAGTVILCVSRLQPAKGISDLLAAAALLSQHGADVHVAVAGGGPLEGELRREVTERGLTNVTLLGQRADVPQLLGAADAFCLPSRHEGSPMSLLEAMAAGLPCVVSAVGGIPAMVAGGCALEVPPRDPAALAAALERVATDAAFAASLSARARARVAERYALAEVARRYTEVYERVARPRRRR